MSSSQSQMWTIGDLLHDKPAEVAQLFERFMAAAQACGPLDVQPLARQVVLHGRRRIFASVRPTARGLRGHLNLPRRVDDPRFTKAEPLTKCLFFHGFTLSSAAELDEEFVGWIREAYTVGQGNVVEQRGGTSSLYTVHKSIPAAAERLAQSHT